MKRYLVFDNGGDLWVWDDKEQVMYQKECDSDICMTRSINLQMFSKFMPYSDVIEETDQRPDWLVK